MSYAIEFTYTSRLYKDLDCQPAACERTACDGRSARIWVVAGLLIKGVHSGVNAHGP